MNKQTQLRIAQKLKAATQRGVSNIQVAIVVLVGILLLLGGLSGYRYIEQAKINNEIQTITDVRASVIRFGAFRDLTGMDENTAATEGFFANTTIRQVGGLVPGVFNQWGGLVTVTGTATGITLTQAGVPGAACIDLVTRLDGVANTVVVGSETVKAAGVASVPMTNAIRTQCNTVGTVAVTLLK
jgi:hypothetical protein